MYAGVHDTSTFCPILLRHTRCYNPPTVQRPRVALRSSGHAASWNGRMRGSVLAFASQREHSPAEERAYQDKASEVDAQCQHVQPSPPGVANAWPQPCADANGDPEVQSYYAECHPFRTIMTCKRNEDFFPAKLGERVHPDCQDVYHEKDCAQQRQKVMQFAIEQARPAAG